VVPGPVSNQTNVTIQVSGDTPGATHPWHIHRGTCGNDQGIVGPPTAYTPIVIGQSGDGSATATLPIPPLGSGQYYVNVHASPSDLKTIVACGNLTKG
jgi:Cu-Zn family superoxide dismutase